MLDGHVSAVSRSVATRHQCSNRVELRGRDALRLRSSHRTNAVALHLLTPVGARLEPVEVDPPRVSAPSHVRRRPAVELRPSHDVLDGKVETGRSLGVDGRRDQPSRESKREARGETPYQLTRKSQKNLR